MQPGNHVACRIYTIYYEQCAHSWKEKGRPKFPTITTFISKHLFIWIYTFAAFLSISIYWQAFRNVVSRNVISGVDTQKWRLVWLPWKHEWQLVRNGKKTNHQENQFVTSSFSTQPPLVQRTNHDTPDHEPASSTSSYSCAAKTHAVFEIRLCKHFTSTSQWQLNHHGVCIPKRRQVNESEKIKCQKTNIWLFTLTENRFRRELNSNKSHINSSQKAVLRGRYYRVELLLFQFEPIAKVDLVVKTDIFISRFTEHRIWRELIWSKANTISLNKNVLIYQNDAVYRKILHLAGSAKVFCRSAQLCRSDLQKSDTGLQKSDTGLQKSDTGLQKSDTGLQKSDTGLQKSNPFWSSLLTTGKENDGFQSHPEHQPFWGYLRGLN